MHQRIQAFNETYKAVDRGHGDMRGSFHLVKLVEYRDEGMGNK